MFKQVDFNLFMNNLEFAQGLDANVKQATSPVSEIEDDGITSYYLADTTTTVNGMGYAIDTTGQLTSVFSLTKGNGSDIIKSAIKNGAKHLDCFDGFLPTFYKKHGFVEVDRVANWTEGEPDIVYMLRK